MENIQCYIIITHLKNKNRVFPSRGGVSAAQADNGVVKELG